MESMRDVLIGSLGRSLRELSDADRLAAAWPVACGSALGAHGEVLDLDAERTLHVRVADPRWFGQFLQVRLTIAEELARISRVPFTGIHFER